MFSQEARCHYGSSQLVEVICQLRFPEILTINAVPPAAFQELIRSEYPQYSVSVETTPPKVNHTPEGLRVQKQPEINNYCFTSTDGIWRVNLTSRFISLTCLQYTGWERFAKQLDMPLAAFIKTFQPAHFERIGLRYLNFISREDLDLVGIPFSELIQPAFLGLLGEESMLEPNALRSSVDAEILLSNKCRAKIHAGPGIVKRNGQTDNEIKFVIDQDLFTTGNVPISQSANALETLHRQAYPIFRSAITDKLHNAMDPEDID